MMNWEAEKDMARDVEENPELYDALADEQRKMDELEAEDHEAYVAMGEVELETEAMDTLTEIFEKQKFQADARVALALLGFCQSDEVSVTRDLKVRKIEN